MELDGVNWDVYRVADNKPESMYAPPSKFEPMQQGHSFSASGYSAAVRFAIPRMGSHISYEGEKSPCASYLPPCPRRKCIQRQRLLVRL